MLRRMTILITFSAVFGAKKRQFSFKPSKWASAGQHAPLADFQAPARRKAPSLAPVFRMSQKPLNTYHQPRTQCLPSVSAPP
jgi:hypothetical protein